MPEKIHPMAVLSSIMTKTGQATPQPPILGLFVPDPHLLPTATTIQCVMILGRGYL